MTTEPALFTDSSAIRRVHREGIVLLGGGRAILMQVSHPAVAAAVEKHSSFKTRRTDRLMRTLKSTLAIAFGDAEESAKAAAGINAIHGRVRSESYDALDPDLLFWVLATLIDTALVMHERFLRPLSEEDAQAYYDDMLTAGELLGVRRELVPRTLAGFEEYMRAQVASLEVTEAARTIARDLFAGPPQAGPMLAGLRSLSAWLLPERIRRGFGLRTGEVAERLFTGGAAFSRLILPYVPARMRAPPAFLLPASAQAARRSGSDAQSRRLSASHQGHSSTLKA